MTLQWRLLGLWLSAHTSKTFLCLILYFTYGNSTMEHRCAQYSLSIILMNNVKQINIDIGSEGNGGTAPLLSVERNALSFKLLLSSFLSQQCEKYFTHERKAEHTYSLMANDCQTQPLPPLKHAFKCVLIMSVYVRGVVLCMCVQVEGHIQQVSLKLDLQEVVSCLVCVLGTKLRSSGRAMCTLNY